MKHCYLTAISKSLTLQDASAATIYLQEDGSQYWFDLTSIDCCEHDFVPIYDTEGSSCSHYWTFLDHFRSVDKSISVLLLDDSLLEIIRRVNCNAELFADRWSRHKYFEPFGKLDAGERAIRREVLRMRAKDRYLKLIPYLISLESICSQNKLVPSIVIKSAPSS